MFWNKHLKCPYSCFQVHDSVINHLLNVELFLKTATSKQEQGQPVLSLQTFHKSLSICVQTRCKKKKMNPCLCP